MSTAVPAEMEFEEIKHPIKVIVRDLSAKGAEVEAPGGEVLRAASCMLTLMLPTRSQPLEIFTSIVDMEHATGDSGQEVHP